MPALRQHAVDDYSAGEARKRLLTSSVLDGCSTGEGGAQLAVDQHSTSMLCLEKYA